MNTASSEPELGAWREIAEGVHVLVAEPCSVNLALVVGSDAALVVDAGSTPAQGRALRAAVARLTDRPLAAVVVTHWHYDHSFGLAGFAGAGSDSAGFAGAGSDSAGFAGAGSDSAGFAGAGSDSAGFAGAGSDSAGFAGAGSDSAGFEGVPTIAHETVRGRLASPEAAEEAARLGFSGADLAVPTRQLALAAAYDLGGGRRVEVVHLGRGHTEGDLMVVVPDADIVFAGDLIESAGPPSYGPDSWPHEWAATLDGLIGLMTSGTRAVPGHGDPVDREFVFGQRGRVAAVSGEITRLAGLGVSVDDAESRGTWALPFEAVRPGYAAGVAQARTSSGPRRPTLPLA